MTKSEFLSQLRRALSGLAPQEVDDIIADYSAHFDEALAAGRSEQQVAHALGDPARLARELRAEAGLRRWETQRTPAALVGAIFGLGGMLALDVLVLLPVMCVFGVVAFVIGIVLFAFGVAGFALLLSGLFHWGSLSGITAALSRSLAGIGMLGGSIGFAALLWLVLEGIVRLLGGYARLHYRVLKPVTGN
ncbi:MAG: DUF1700 domain-containing protein [Steroidobacteraceae bacterium]